LAGLAAVVGFVDLRGHLVATEIGAKGGDLAGVTREITAVRRVFRERHSGGTADTDVGRTDGRRADID